MDIRWAYVTCTWDIRLRYRGRKMGNKKNERKWRHIPGETHSEVCKVSAAGMVVPFGRRTNIKNYYMRKRTEVGDVEGQWKDGYKIAEVDMSKLARVQFREERKRIVKRGKVHPRLWHFVLWFVLISFVFIVLFHIFTSTWGWWFIPETDVIMH